jgi:protein-S-isoprenylcysteine O-methyltransferase Ste14
MRMGQALPLALGAVCFVSFGAGMFFVFRKGGRPRPGLRLIQVTAPIAAGTQLWAMAMNSGGPAWRPALGTALFLTSEALFLATSRTTWRQKLTLAFATDVPSFLNDRGPYGVIRHPFYASYLLAYLAGCVASGNPWTLVVLGVMGAIYTTAARREEAKFMRSQLAPTYARYAARTGMFIPCPISRRHASLPLG